MTGESLRLPAFKRIGNFITVVIDHPAIWSRRYGCETLARVSVRNLVAENFKKNGSGLGLVICDDSARVLFVCEATSAEHANVPELIEGPNLLASFCENESEIVSWVRDLAEADDA